MVESIETFSPGCTWRLATVPANYQLFLEEEGDKPDKAISDSESVSLEGHPKHFFAVPPATFGFE